MLDTAYVLLKGTQVLSKGALALLRQNKRGTTTVKAKGPLKLSRQRVTTTVKAKGSSTVMAKGSPPLLR